MASTRAMTPSVLEKFPDRWHIIVELCRTDEDFRELCDHYGECAAVITRLRTKTEPEAGRAAEYEEVMKELEREIGQILDIQGARRE